jgi:transcriptional regulator with XRE-family HTH domain
MNEQHTLGGFITRKRNERDMTLRGLAQKVGISPVYLCNIEKGRRPMTAEETLDKIAAELLLNKDEKALLLDLAAKSKSIPIVAADLPEYINERDIVRVALRTAKDVDATDEEWQEFIEKLQKRILRESPEKIDGG